MKTMLATPFAVAYASVQRTFTGEVVRYVGDGRFETVEDAQHEADTRNAEHVDDCEWSGTPPITDFAIVVDLRTWQPADLF